MISSFKKTILPATKIKESIRLAESQDTTLDEYRELTTGYDSVL